MAARSIALAAALSASLSGCAALPAILAAGGQIMPLLQIGAAVAVDVYCSEIVGADGRDAIRSHVYGDRRRTLIQRKGC